MSRYDLTKPKPIRFTADFWQTLEKLAKTYNMAPTTLLRVRLEEHMLTPMKRELNLRKKKEHSA